MKLWTCTVLVLILLLGMTSVLARDEAVEQSSLVKVGSAVPAFTLNILNGQAFDSTAMKGKVMLINFWATWCPPCKKEMPPLQKEVFEGIQDPDFVMVAISRGEAEAVVREFLADNPYTFPIALDTDKKIYSLFATQYIPRNYVVDKQGVVQWASIGFEEDEFAAMVKQIKAELAKPYGR